MSRSALWRKEANVIERQRQANETFQLALEEGRMRSQKGLVKLTNDTHFNLNPMLLSNISSSPYFLKCCNNLKDWNSLVDEIYYQVKSLEPWSNDVTKTPSTAFCLLLRLLTMRCTTKEMEQMLNHVDSPYIRCIGFLYLRLACDPKEIWDWFMPYLYDTEEVKVTERKMAQHHKKKGPKNYTVGDFVRSLLQDLDFYGTRLPRFPPGVEKDIKAKLLEEEQIEARAVRHENDKRTMESFQKVGSRVRALYGDEENEVTWYDAVVDRVVWRDDETGEQYTRPKFVVTFIEYGNTEVVSLGEMDVIGGSDVMRSNNSTWTNGAGTKWNNRMDHRKQDPEWSHSHNQSHNNYERNNRGSNNYHSPSQREWRSNDDRSRGRYCRYNDRQPYTRDRSRSRDRVTHGDFASYGKGILRDEGKPRDQEQVSSSGSDYASLSASFKQSISGKGPADSYNGYEKREPSAIAKLPDKHKTCEELAAIEEKKRKLMAKYG